jgi:hypothetical protein
MQDALLTLAGVAVTTGAVSLAVRLVVKNSVNQLFEAQRMRLDAELERGLKAYQAQLDVWSKQEASRSKYLVEEKGAVIAAIASHASTLRRLLLGIGVDRNTARIKTAYGYYCDLYYENPVLPKVVYDPAHDFRRAAGEAIGAAEAASNGAALAEPVVERLNGAFDRLRDAASSVLFPRN